MKSNIMVILIGASIVVLTGCESATAITAECPDTGGKSSSQTTE